MSTKKKTVFVPRTVALCYVRLSLTRDESDLNSPERQRSNILVECQRRGWMPEWYEDVDGHKSGTEEENRPGWMALKARLADPDVIGIVANDLSRLHRKGWRVGNLIDMLDEYGIGLVLAAPGRNLDLSGAAGKISTMIMALMDEYYATDTSQKQKDSVQYRRAKGVIVGRIPFGTVRNKEGYLQRSPYGVWLLPDGIYVEDSVGHPAPHEDAIWRGFADAVQRCLEIFTENQSGRRKIADKLNQEGYRFVSQEGYIVPFNDDDIRRITANWIEYGGGMLPGKARNRRCKEVTPETVVLNPERAIFDMDLCSQVAYVQQKRTRDRTHTPDYGIHLDAQMYPLSKLIYCAHCEQLAQSASDNAARSYLTGRTSKQKISRSYRHDTERHCAAKHRSVKADILERDFLRLLASLTVNSDALPLLTQALEYFNTQNQTEDEATLIQAEIAHWRQRLKNADILFSNARISEEDWREMVANAEHEIARLQTQVIAHHEAELALKITLDMVANLVQNWHQSKPEMRRSLAGSVFEYVVYDLDIRQIVDFKLKPWAELLMQLNVTLDGGKKIAPVSDESKGVLWCAWRDSNPRQLAP